MKHVLAFVDVETTDLDPVKGRIVEFAAELTTPYPELATVKTFQRKFLLSPGDLARAHPKALEVNGYPKGWETAQLPTFSDWQEIADVLANAVLVGQNVIAFDAPWILSELVRFGVTARPPWQRRMLDTMGMAYLVAQAKGLSAWGLHPIYEAIGGPALPPHSAMPDVARAKYLFRHFAAHYEGGVKLAADRQTLGTKTTSGAPAGDIFGGGEG